MLDLEFNLIKVFDKVDSMYKLKFIDCTYELIINSQGNQIANFPIQIISPFNYLSIKLFDM